MTRSSNAKQQGVKRFTPKQRETLLKILEPLNLKDVITDGIDDYIGSGTRLLLGLLLHAEAEELCGKWHEHDKDRQFVRWGTEKGKALIHGAKRQIERPRIRVARNMDGKVGEVQLDNYRLMNEKELLDQHLIATILRRTKKDKKSLKLTVLRKILASKSQISVRKDNRFILRKDTPLVTLSASQASGGPLACVFVPLHRTPQPRQITGVVLYFCITKGRLNVYN